MIKFTLMPGTCPHILGSTWWCTLVTRIPSWIYLGCFAGSVTQMPFMCPHVLVCLCWGLTSQSTIFQSCRDGATASWVINQYFWGVKCLAQGHNTAEVGFEPQTSRSGVRHSTTKPPRSPAYIGINLMMHTCHPNTFLNLPGMFCRQCHTNAIHVSAVYWDQLDDTHLSSEYLPESTWDVLQAVSHKCHSCVRSILGSTWWYTLVTRIHSWIYLGCFAGSVTQMPFMCPQYIGISLMIHTYHPNTFLNLHGMFCRKCHTNAIQVSAVYWDQLDDTHLSPEYLPESTWDVLQVESHKCHSCVRSILGSSVHDTFKLDLIYNYLASNSVAHKQTKEMNFWEWTHFCISKFKGTDFTFPMQSKNYLWQIRYIILSVPLDLIILCFCSNDDM